MRSLPPIACCLGLLAVSRPAAGAQAARLKPGARVRLDAPHLETRINVLGGLGALVGIIAGSDTKKRWWTPVPLNGGRALGLRISF